DIVTKADGAVGQVGGRAVGMVATGPKVLAQEIQGLDVPREAKGRARDIAEEIDKTKQKTRHSDLYRDILNYDYRFREVAVERTQEADDARKKRYFARKAYYDGDPRAARDGWVDAMQSWQDLLNKEEFADISIDSQFIREIIEIVDKFVIILDNINEIFTGKEPLQGLIRNKLKQDSDPDEVLAALDYAKGTFEKGDYAKCEEYFSRICNRFEGINFSTEFMKLAPLPDLRDKALEANAYYIRTLRKLDKPLPEPLPLRSYVELMMKHDEAFAAAVNSAQTGFQLLHESKAAEAQAAFDKSIELWKPLLDKYPLIPLDSTLQNYAELKLLAAGYVKALQDQKKELPKDFILNEFMK
ncbi:MAG: hypothetical protein FWE67_05025, partial [Planctomycetaceae bacterium]|nr:hypothetical protein [Planctomycetaceae bacterium]